MMGFGRKILCAAFMVTSLAAVYGLSSLTVVADEIDNSVEVIETEATDIVSTSMDLTGTNVDLTLNTKADWEIKGDALYFSTQYDAAKVEGEFWKNNSKNNDFSGITRIVLGEGVTQIGGGAFQNATSITEVVFTDEVNYIAEFAFSGCTGLTMVELPASVEAADAYSFNNCSSLEKIIIRNSNIRLGENCIGYLSDSEGNWGFSDALTVYAHLDSTGEAYAKSPKWSSSHDTNDQERLKFEPIYRISYSDAQNVYVDKAGNPVEYIASIDGTVTLKHPANRSEMIFEGWYADGERIEELSAETITKDTVITAQWINATFAGCKVTLSNNYDLKYFVEMPECIANDESARMEFIVGDSVQQVKYSAYKDGYAMYDCEVAIKDTRKNIVASLCYDGKKYQLTDTVNVGAYLQNIINNPNHMYEYAFAKDIAEALLDYSYYAQVYFKDKDLSADGADLSSEKVESVTAEEITAAYDMELEVRGKSSFEYLGTSMVCQSDTDLKIYLSNDKGLSLDEIKERYEFSVIGGSNPVAEISTGVGYVVLTLKSIPAAELDNLYCFLLRDVAGTDYIEIYNSPMIYILDVLKNADSEDPALKNLCRAMYLYNKAANEYYARYAYTN